MYTFTNYLVMYDICDSKRLVKINSLLKGYFFQEQHSVFQGRLTKSRFNVLREKLVKIMDKNKDCIIIYPMSKFNILNKEILGVTKYRKSQIF